MAYALATLRGVNPDGRTKMAEDGGTARWPWRWALHWQIALALACGLIAGLAAGEREIAGFAPVALFDFLGTLFLRALKMVIVPLLAGSIITGVAGLGSARSLGRLFGRTFTWYICTSLLAIFTGLLLVNLIRPGLDDGVPVGDSMGLTAETATLDEELGGRGPGDLVDIVLRMVPENPVAAASEGQMLPLIFFCMLFGAALTLLAPDRRETQIRFWEGLFAVMMTITGWVIRFAPVGVFGLIARIAATSGVEAFASLLRFAATVLLALFIHAVIVLPLLLHLVGRIDPRRHARVMAPALMTAFTTRSSSATLPLTMKCVEKGAGVSNRVTSFVLPLGATVNMDGTALYECICALFIAQAYGVALGPVDQFLVVVTALLASIGAAGIPSAGLVMISIILSTVGLPLEGVALILAVDPLLDMCRTAVNVFSDSCGAVVIARREGETDLYPESAE
jgi:Na+/H+-dicarboxylate symporter